MSIVQWKLEAESRNIMYKTYSTFFVFQFLDFGQEGDLAAGSRIEDASLAQTTIEETQETL